MKHRSKRLRAMRQRIIETGVFALTAPARYPIIRSQSEQMIIR
ncbi:MAG: hypothetical protein V4801_36410 [Burkholderia gladioli]